MSAAPSDITPEHVPIGLARDTLAQVEAAGPRAQALVIGFLYETEDGELALHYESCGFEKRDVLWCLENMRKSLLDQE